MSEGEMVRVEINWEAEVYPEMVVSDSPDRGLIEIPRQLLRDLQEAEATVRQAEVAIASYVAERYPDVTMARCWLAANTTR